MYSYDLFAGRSSRRATIPNRVQPHRPAKNKRPIVDYDSSYDMDHIPSDVEYIDVRSTEHPVLLSASHQDMLFCSS
jgi:hypothetical protein